ncbi:MAG: cell division protein FtsQ/DivIB [Pseudomonadales bacterium]|nr:cell division protein FtsQ/DivIB [Pseudomonadales bacterium]
MAPRVGLLMLAVLLFSVLLSLPELNEQIAVKKILINKSLHYVEKNDVDALLEQALEQNFFFLELKDVAQIINHIPWVESAQVKKIWPDTILVNIQEQSPVARWGETKLISATGEVFEPGDLTAFEYLPHLVGSEAQRAKITDFYYQANKILSSSGLNIAAVKIESSYEWSLLLDNGLLVILSSMHGLEKVKQFSEVYGKHISPKLDSIARVDLRYDSGFVVAWKENNNGLGSKSLALR